ncbi:MULTISPECIES: extracellular solute-binding protein [Actibacterium]|uniref:extracellular solute-binding protein n=1 Tax=Actibacterium TaxID=1433986 RepID=UPI0006C8ECCB|nr:MULTISPECIES: extracellular solute-binding protein [Actibacterium]ALG90274.1 ABC transporter substrate-binding protein [Actibacterium sp. EMB200-NS6]
MRSMFFAWRGLIAAASVLILCTGSAWPEPRHGIAMYGEPALPPDFVSLPYVNPDAPKGGRIVTGEVGRFDSLNPHILKGRVPWQLQFLAYESLMGRSWDEPFTLYGLLAESIETGPNRDWVEFTLRPEARFSDGTPVTVEDVLWSYETLGTVGHPRYHGSWQKVARAEAVGERTLRFTFNTEDRELPLILGMRPILKKAQWAGKDFAQSGLTEVPITTAPYVVADFDPGRFVLLRRNPDYWGNDLPLRRGTNNFDEIRLEFFADANAMFEAFKAGVITSNRETSAAKWAGNYDFPAVRSGEVVKSDIPHKRPSGISGLVFNTRNPIFADWRVRDALIHAFNFEFINQTLNGGALPRITSYFSNSVLAMSHGPAEGPVKALLAPFADDLPPGALEGYSLPVSDGSQSNRRNLRKAVALLEQAGWSVADDGILRNAGGTPFTFEIVLNQGATETRQIVDIYAEALKRLGIFPKITAVDSAQYKERTTAYDFDMAYYIRGQSLSPGNEQMLYWGAEGVSTPGTLNWMGMQVPAAEAMIRAILTAQSGTDFEAATRALDRVLTTGRYVIPIWFSPTAHIAHSKNLHYPETIPMYGDWIGFQPEIWWYAED